MRSVDVYRLYIVYASVKERKGGRLFSRDPANARGVGVLPSSHPRAQLTLNDNSHTTPWYELVVFFGKVLGFRALFLGTPGDEKSIRRASPHP